MARRLGSGKTAGKVARRRWRRGGGGAQAAEARWHATRATPPGALPGPDRHPFRQRLPVLVLLRSFSRTLSFALRRRAGVAQRSGRSQGVARWHSRSSHSRGPMADQGLCGGRRAGAARVAGFFGLGVIRGDCSRCRAGRCARGHFTSWSTSRPVDWRVDWQECDESVSLFDTVRRDSTRALWRVGIKVASERIPLKRTRNARAGAAMRGSAPRKTRNRTATTQSTRPLDRYQKRSCVRWHLTQKGGTRGRSCVRWHLAQKGGFW